LRGGRCDCGDYQAAAWTTEFFGTTLRWNFRGAGAAPGMADSYNPFIVYTAIKIILASTAERRDASRPCIDGGTPLIDRSVTRLFGRRSPEFISWVKVPPWRTMRFTRVNL